MPARRMIRYATIASLGTDDQNRPIQEVSYSAGPDGVLKTAPAVICLPWGTHGNLPIGYPGLLFAIQGRAENLAFFPLSWRQRLGDSPAGDHVLFSPEHPETEIRQKANGDVEITTDGNHIEIVNGNISITCTGTMALTSTGAMTLTAPTITLDTPATNVTGTLEGTPGIDLVTHKHAQGNDSDGDAEVDTEVPKA